MLLMMPMQSASTMPLEIGIALIAAYGATLTAYVGIVAVFYWRLGQVPTRQEFIELRNELKTDNAQFREETKAEMAQLRGETKAEMAQLRGETKAEMAQLREETKAEMAQFREETKADMAQLRADIREDMALLREEFRRSHQQIMLALANHSHREGGQAVFTLPPELETTPSPADN